MWAAKALVAADGGVMLIVTTLSLAFAAFSLLGSTYICCSTVAVACRGFCCCGGSGDGGNASQESIQRILFAISFADLISSACWISTQTMKLSGAPDVPLRCLTAGILGQFSFIAMSLWTAVLASCTRSVLTQGGGTSRVIGGGRFVGLGVWGASATCALLLYVGHSSCRDHHGGSGSGGSGSGSVRAPEAMVQLQRLIWRVCFVGLPLATILLCLAEYSRVSYYYRKLYALLTRSTSHSAADLEEQLTSAVADGGDDGGGGDGGASASGANGSCGGGGGDDGGDDGDGDKSATMDERCNEVSASMEPPRRPGHGAAAMQALRELRARRLDFNLKLNRRLLTYLLAYVLCEAPGLPNALQQAWWASDGDYLDDGYLELEETSPLVSMRVLAQSLQGLANAIAFAHHTGSLHGWLTALWWQWNAAWRKSDEFWRSSVAW